MIDQSLIWAIYITFWVWFIYSIYNWFRAFSKEYKEKMAKSVEELNSKFHLLEIEVANGQYLVYNKLTKQFLLQASSLPDLIDKYQNTYPNMNGVFVGGEQTIIDQLNTYIKEKEKHENRTSIGSTS
jgi:hypothetical protein